MLEDFTMEKKPSSRSVQTPSKGCGTEGKKVQDSTNSNVGKQSLRQSRRREPPGPKWDQNRKSFPQKQNKTAYDNKRPKPRGQLHYDCGKANTEVVDELTEQFGLVGTSPNGGTKKQSLNHLLNFHYAPRNNEGMVSSSHHWLGDSTGRTGHRSYYNGSARWLMSTQKHKYNKEQFLQANCQFVVRSDGNYTAYMGDPDILVDWEKIEQVRVISCEEVNCPICLSTPVAGKITRCGHVFCWSCMLHYLALSDKSWRKCPICFESVHRQDLKSVQILLRTTPAIGEQITFRLMKREKGSLIASPVSQYDARALQGLLSVGEEKLDIIYSKLLTATIDQVSSIIAKEKAELNVLVTENEGCPELCFIEQALQLLQEREQALSARCQQLSNVFTHGTTTTDNNSEINNSLSSFVMKSWSADDLKCSDSSVPDISFAKDHYTRCSGDLNSDNQSTPLHNSKVDEAAACAANDIADGDLLFLPTPPVIDHGFVFDGFDEEYREVILQSADSTEHQDKAPTERHRYISASSTSEGEDSIVGTMPQFTTITAEDLEISSMLNNVNGNGNKHFYFYQAEDGQQLFLHAVNIRMLIMSYGSLDNSPLLITGTILEKESGSMTEELRKRLRYLQHLPVTCQFEVAEIDLQPPIITADTSELFKEQLEIRRKRREKRARDERRRERKMVEQVHRQYGRGPTPRLRIESLHHFPQCGSELASSPSVTVTASVTTSALTENIPVGRSSPSSSRASSPVSIVSSTPPSSSTGLSFAQMLRNGKSSGGGWHTNAERPQPSTVLPQMPYDSDTESNPSAAPHFRQSFSDAIAAAFEQATVMHSKDEQLENNKGGGKKKKRKQKVVLFATGMACNSK